MEPPDTSVTHHRAFFHGGAELSVRMIELDAFGVLAAPIIRGLGAETKADRKKSIRDLAKLARSYNLLRPHDNVLSVGITTDGQGRQRLTFITETGLTEQRR